MLVGKIQFVLMLICTLAAATVKAYEYDANDFVTEVVEYVKGQAAEQDVITGLPFDNPASALGRPTIDTTGDNYDIVPVSTIVPVVCVYPPFRSFELVTVGRNGKLVVKFNHPVRDDENNPYGIDFIVFSNAAQYTGSYDHRWTNGNPVDFIVYGDELIEDGAVVSVSQDGVNWYKYTDGPYADGFAPTLGRIYDPNHPDQSIGSWNLWWGHATDPTLPLDPTLSVLNFVDKTVAQISHIYGESAGGTGFDLSESGMEWIQYVKVECKTSKTPEVDALADVSCCGDWKHPFPAGDITHDCNVDYEDLSLLADFWLDAVTGPEDPATVADIYGDNIINFKDWAIMSKSWLECSWQCE